MLYTFVRRAAKKVKASANLFKNESPVSGFEPPLYDRSLGLWAYWPWGLVAMDIIFTVASCDLVLNHWSEQVVKDPDSEALKISNQNASSGGGNNTIAPSVIDAESSEYEYVLRPRWQRFSLTAGQFLVGVAIGGGILAARDRMVCRLRILRPDNLAASPVMNRGTMKISGDTRWLEVENASRRKKKFMMQDCEIALGRNDTEMHLKVQNIRGQYVLGMKNAKVLGQTETNSKSLQHRLLAAWRDRPGQVSSFDRSGWTGGPVLTKV